MRIACVFLLASAARAALNVGTHAPEDLVTRLRQSIFIETSLLEERAREPAPTCSSLDGPRCLGVLLNNAHGTPSHLAFSGAGVLPDRLLHDLGIGGARDMAFVSPGYDVLEVYRRQHAALLPVLGLPPLAGPEEDALLRNARGRANWGLLHFDGSMPDRRVPLSFSQGLPEEVIATWDGRWMVKDCATKGLALALPAPGEQYPVTSRALQGLATGLAQPAHSDVSVVVELAGSLGYLRFSRPVMVRSLFGRWQPPAGSPSALIGGRLGLQTVWATHLDPSKFGDLRGWADLSGGRLQPVDEVVFVAMPGLEIAAVEVVSGEDVSIDGEGRLALFLVPVSSHEDQQHKDKAQSLQPKFTLKMQKLSPSAAPFVASLQEVVEQNLRIRSSPGFGWLLADQNVSSVLPPPDAANTQRALQAASNEAMFHQVSTAFPAGGPEAQTMFLKLLQTPPDMLPPDLRRDLVRERAEIIDAAQAWSSKKGWRHRTPTSLPYGGTEEALQRYATAKKWQTKLDMLTVAFVYLRPHLRFQ